MTKDDLFYEQGWQKKTVSKEEQLLDLIERSETREEKLNLLRLAMGMLLAGADARHAAEIERLKRG